MGSSIFIGTSGWFYQHWRGIFYPDDMKPDKWLTYYSKFFNTVENNSSFYHLPKESTIKRWHKKVGDNFLYAVKIWRRITHYQKLVDIKEPLKIFIDRISLLGNSLGVLLAQFPPSMKKDLTLLENFIKLLPKDMKCAFEFRNKSWIDQEVVDLLKAYNQPFCIADSARYYSDVIVTSDLVYIRFHGPGSLYSSSYNTEQLKIWATKIKAWRNEKRIILAYFNNDFNGYAVKNAMELMDLIKKSE